jgi:hypothetical protein
MNIYPGSAVLVYPRFDQATIYTNYFGKKAYAAIGGYYEDIKALKGKDATRANTEDSLHMATDCLFHFDHGGVDKLGGYNKEVILDLDNIDELEGMHVYSYSCLSASKLGPRAVRNGCFSYVGFRLPAMVYPLAAPFMKNQAVYYPVHLTKELEELNLEYPDLGQELPVVKRVFRESKREGFRQALYAIVTLYGAVILFYNMLHYSLCLPEAVEEAPEEDLSCLLPLPS